MPEQNPWTTPRGLEAIEAMVAAGVLCQIWEAFCVVTPIQAGKTNTRDCILEVAALEFLDDAFSPADWGITNNRLTWYVWHMVKGHRTMASEGEGESRVDALISAVLAAERRIE